MYIGASMMYCLLPHLLLPTAFFLDCLLSDCLLCPQAVDSGFNRLFINWHPGPLGHEVMGNQAAYYHLTIMQAALDKVIAGEDSAALEAVGAILPVPEAVQCNERMCPKGGGVHCAYSFLPHWDQGVEVGDIMLNGTTGVSGWKNMNSLPERTDPARCNEGDWDGESMQGQEIGFWSKCWDRIKFLSYYDQKRGMFGTDKSGPIVLKIPPMKVLSTISRP
jgi:hypothetical protein